MAYGDNSDGVGLERLHVYPRLFRTLEIEDFFHTWPVFFCPSWGTGYPEAKYYFTLQHFKGQRGKVEWAVQDLCICCCSLSGGYLKCSEASLQARFEGLNERLKR
ncbi:hypothetical protein AMECASPLE_029641 [Ameca splendens]|uniref:Uncharacterized protein n=1 Tax=Ameca splendens TaxID=208324 RepID=A0ABV0Y5R4_9TELE